MIEKFIYLIYKFIEAMRVYIALLLVLVLVAGVYASPSYVEKTVVRSITVSPSGSVVKAEAQVTLVVEGKGTVSLVDRTAFINSSLRTYGVEPSRVDVAEYFAKVEWSRLTVSDRVTLKYSAPLDRIPVRVSARICVNGSEAELKYFNGICVVEAGEGDLIEYELRVFNELELAGAKPLLLAVVTWAIDTEKFGVLNCSPGPTLVTGFGETRVYTWSTMLNESLVIRVGFVVKKTSMWGDACLQSPQIDIVLDPSSMLTSIEDSITGLEESLRALELIECLSSNTTEALKMMSSVLKNLSTSMLNYSILLRSCADISLKASGSLREGSEKSYELSRTLSKISREAKYFIGLKRELEEYSGEVEAVLEYLDELEEYLSEVNVSQSELEELLCEKEYIVEKLRELKSILDRLEEIVEDVDEASVLTRELGEKLEESSGYMGQLAVLLYNASDMAEELALNASEWASEIDEKVLLIEEKLSLLTEVKEKLSERLECLRSQRDALVELDSIYSGEKPLVRYEDGREAEGRLLADIVKVKVYSIVVQKPWRRHVIVEEKEDKGKSGEVDLWLLLLLTLVAPLVLFAKTGLKAIKREDYSSMVKEIEELSQRLEELREGFGKSEES